MVQARCLSSPWPLPGHRVEKRVWTAPREVLSQSVKQGRANDPAARRRGGLLYLDGRSIHGIVDSHGATISDWRAGLPTAMLDKHCCRYGSQATHRVSSAPAKSGALGFRAGPLRAPALAPFVCGLTALLLLGGAFDWPDNPVQKATETTYRPPTRHFALPAVGALAAVPARVTEVPPTRPRSVLGGDEQDHRFRSAEESLIAAVAVPASPPLALPSGRGRRATPDLLHWFFAAPSTGPPLSS